MVFRVTPVALIAAGTAQQALAAATLTVQTLTSVSTFTAAGAGFDDVSVKAGLIMSQAGIQAAPFFVQGCYELEKGGQALAALASAYMVYDDWLFGRFFL